MVTGLCGERMTTYESSIKVDLTPSIAPIMQVVKRDGRREPVDVSKIVKAVDKHCTGLASVDPMKVAITSIGGLFDGASTAELDTLSIQTAANLIGEEPEYSQLAARMLATYIDKEVRGQDIQSFSQSVARGFELGLINERLATFVQSHAWKLNSKVDFSRDWKFEYFGLRTLYDRYLLKHPNTRKVLESPQYFFMRIACALMGNMDEAIALYDKMSNLEYMPSTPTLFNAGATSEQLSSCFLLDSPQDDLGSIYNRYGDIAKLSKYAGGIGLSYSRVRSRGSLIKGTNGYSNGIVPWLKVLDSSVTAVNQGGKRQGACCVYLETWHADIEEFLELRNNTGDELLRTHNLNLAHWVPDLFMKRVEADMDWSLFDPKDVPSFVDKYGEDFEHDYLLAEAAGFAKRVIPARELYSKMMRMLATTGNGWMTFKDTANAKANQVYGNNIIHSSNLCTEIMEVSNEDDTAVCNLGSINLAKHFVEGTIDWSMLEQTVKLAVTQLDNVIDLNFYTIEGTKSSNMKWRPIGLGVMGLQDIFFKLGIPFDDEYAQQLQTKIFEFIHYHALKTSNQLAATRGSHSDFIMTKAASGKLQPDLWPGTETTLDWDSLKEDILNGGLRNSLVMANAPTATIASICGSYECIEPQVSNLFKRETLSGDFIQLNPYLVQCLKAHDAWNDDTRAAIKRDNGSVQGLDVLTDDEKRVFRTVWEIPMASIIDMAAQRGPFIDQSQSLNLFVENPNIGPLSSMYMYAWKKGLKSTYYLRSRPATRIQQTTVSATKLNNDIAMAAIPQLSDAEMVACSLENPEECEACQ